MQNIVVISDGPEGLVQLQDIINQLQLEVPEVEPKGYEPEDLIEDDDLPLIVQMLLSYEIDFSPGFTMKKWVDTNIDADDLEHYRAQFPEQEYRLVAVYDEIVTVDESVEPVDYEFSAEDENGMLKAEVLNLKAQIAQLENAQ